ncbi:MAG: ornithine carbamoyltransferase [SAR202 cluster bacterium Io17-Chloro-G9]|nr:MAG: ornithine carbamoyltransferase [SAR202 cluster bacterium Io17-Chloro-G9]
MTEKRHFISITDFSAEETRHIIQRARLMKDGEISRPLEGKNVALLFEKPSLRTKVSFEVGINHLGGHPIYLAQQEVGLGIRESVSDVARVLSGFVDCIIARVDRHQDLVELAEYSSVPVVNALSNWEHPCQIIADLMTIQEHKGGLEGLKLCYIGDGNNVARSLCLGLPPVGVSFTIASPPANDKYHLDQESLNLALRSANGKGSPMVLDLRDPVAAVQGADIVYTDAWTSMGQEAESEARRRDFQGFTVDPELMSKANPDAIFMHDMPAHYGEEVPPGMLDHGQSVAYHQANNRLHGQKGILEFLFTN